jgi:hypothetical protein
MPDDLYPESESAPGDQGNIPPKDAEKPSTDAETALMPKAMLGEVTVGQTVTVKVVHIYEDEVEVEKVNDGGADKGTEPSYAGEIKSLAEETPND